MLKGLQLNSLSTPRNESEFEIFYFFFLLTVYVRRMLEVLIVHRYVYNTVVFLLLNTNYLKRKVG